MSRLWIPEAPALNFNKYVEFAYESPAVLIAGRFCWEVLSKSGLIVRSGRWQRNLITDAGLEALATNAISVMATYLAVGTGSTVPANSDVALVAEAARTNATDSIGIGSGYDNTDAANPFWYVRISRLFTSPLVNTNYAECGAFKSAAGAPMLSRSLLKDVAGNPTVVTVNTDEQLRLVYEWRVYPPMTDTVASFNATVRGVATAVVCTTRAFGITDANSWGIGGAGQVAFVYNMPAAGFHSSGPGSVWETNVLPAVTGAPAGYSVARSSAVRAAYVANNRYYDSTLTWNAGVTLPSSGQIGGFKHYSCYSGNAGDTRTCFFTALVPKLAVTSADKVIATFRHSWARKP